MATSASLPATRWAVEMKVLKGRQLQADVGSGKSATLP